MASRMPSGIKIFSVGKGTKIYASSKMKFSSSLLK